MTHAAPTRQTAQVFGGAVAGQFSSKQETAFSVATRWPREMQ
jgi:hypothetical protein